MPNVTLRFNLDSEEVELTYDGEVALSSGTEVFKSWVDAYNEKHKPAPAPVVVDVAPAAPEAEVENETVEETTEPAEGSTES